jgi:hypothetical protein
MRGTTAQDNDQAGAEQEHAACEPQVANQTGSLSQAVPKNIQSS